MQRQEKNAHDVRGQCFCDFCAAVIEAYLKALTGFYLHIFKYTIRIITCL